ncbi:ABC transporter permease [Blastococcus brunescens]|uniref:ABC transporter permease n=1 Tax=Blastococcus brunescens TaxID=1564165 RepID=A0ABZ1AYD5_9ACTN|nr:ABC transporter permease [Blastococcus sp. BMG 8361]WRL63581.1 ABC transporter permease [Blastococcus sp. BMG 8361]
MNRKIVLLAIEILSPLVLLTLWYVWSANSTSFYFPPLSLILERFGEVWLGEGLVEHALPSLGRMATGYFVGAVVGVVLGTALGLSTWARRLLGPTVEFLRALPAVVLIPFGIVVFGVDTTMKVFIIALGCCFPVVLNTADGVRSVEPTLMDVSRSFGFTRAERLWRVTLPSASPQIFAGLRTSLALALILMVVSEMVASTNGVGYSILQAQRLFATADMWAGILLLGLLGYLINLVLVLVERRVLAWHRGFRGSELGWRRRPRRRGPAEPRLPDRQTAPVLRFH